VIYNTVAIVGVGLIGGSVGLALRKRRLAKKIIGIGRTSETLAKAKSLKCVTDITTDLAEGVKSADLIILCTPVELIVDQVCEIAKHCPAHAIITDCGSTKNAIVTALSKSLLPTLKNNVQFVGGHPLAGSEKTGPEHARADLFEGRIVVVTPSKSQTIANDDKNSQEVIESVRDVAEFWSSLGASVVMMSPAEHDAALASTSHLPHIVASALARATDKSNLLLTAGGWRDSTRIAAGDSQLWTQIALSNQKNLLKALAGYESSLKKFIAALKKGDPKQLSQLFAEAKEIRDAVGS
jgi:prephenate dehydrogenase